MMTNCSLNNFQYPFIRKLSHISENIFSDNWFQKKNVFNFQHLLQNCLICLFNYLNLYNIWDKNNIKKQIKTIKHIKFKLYYNTISIENFFKLLLTYFIYGILQKTNSSYKRFFHELSFFNSHSKLKFYIYFMEGIVILI